MTDSRLHRRHHSRIPFDAQYRLTTSESKQVYHGQIIDLSLKGALIERPGGLTIKTGDHVSLDLLLGNGEVQIQMQVRVAHLHEKNIGVVCEHLDLNSMSHLCRFLELNLGSHTQLERELLEMIRPNTH